MAAMSREERLAKTFVEVEAQYDMATIVMPDRAKRVYAPLDEIVLLLKNQAAGHLEFMLDPDDAVPGFVAGFGFDPKVRKHFVLFIDDVDPENVFHNV